MHFFTSNRSKSVGSPPSSNTANHLLGKNMVQPGDKKASTSPNQGGSKVSSGKSSSSEEHERISLTRSDGVTQDLLNVFSKPGVTEVVHTSSKEEGRKSVSDHHDEHQNITISRSDGVTHDLIQVFKAVSDAQGDTLKIKGGRAPSVGKLDLSSAIGLTPPMTSPNANSISVNREVSSAYYPKSVRIVHYSDTHNFLIRSPKDHQYLPHGDILVHTGNFTNSGTDAEFIQFNDWLGSVTDLYHYRIVILGHRDVKAYGNTWDVMKKFLTNATHVLCHDEVTVLGIRFYGAPWHWGHKVNYTLRPGAPTSTTGRFDDIPAGIHCLLTHGPSYDRLDTTYSGNSVEHWGSRELSEAIRKVRPGLHLHGHVKDSRGIYPEFGNNPLTVNSSMVDKDVTVLYATPHVIRATQALFDRNKNVVTWSFVIDSFDG